MPCRLRIKSFWKAELGGKRSLVGSPMLRSRPCHSRAQGSVQGEAGNEHKLLLLCSGGERSLQS